MDRSLVGSILAALVVAVTLHLLLHWRGFYSIGLDESGRILDAYTWATRGTVTTKAWLPFYRVLVGLALKVHPDLVLTPRLISLCFGLGAIVAVTWLARELFEDRRTTLLTLWMGTLFSQRVALSIAPLSSIQFICLTLCSMALLVRWLRTDASGALFVGALVAALTTTIRYEAWLFGAAWLAVVGAARLAGRTRVRAAHIAALGIAVFAYPLVRALSEAQESGETFNAFTSRGTHYPLIEALKRNPATQFVWTNARNLNLVGIAAFPALLRRDAWSGASIGVAFFGPLAITSLGLLLLRNAQSGPAWRMIGVWSMLLLPFTTHWLVAIGRRSGKPFAARSAALASTLIVLVAFTADTVRIERQSRPAFPEAEREAGRYFESRIEGDPKTRILIESASFRNLNILIASGHPEAFVWNHREPILRHDAPVSAIVAQHGCDLLAYVSPEHKRFLDESPDVTPIEKFGDWSVYRVSERGRSAGP